MKKFINNIILIVWGVFSIFMALLVGKIGFDVFLSFNSNVFELKEVSSLILLMELSFMGLKAVLEGGHFPLRYLVLFLDTAFILNLSVSKGEYSPIKIMVNITSIVILSYLYLFINKYNIKNKTKD